MRILLLILKIIGILLLVILFLAVLLVFYPVFYQIEGNIEEKISLHGRISWLFRIVRFEFDMEDSEMKSKIGILGFHWDMGEEKTEEAKSEHPATEVQEISDTNETKQAKEHLKEFPSGDTVMPSGGDKETEDRNSADSQNKTKAKKSINLQKESEEKEPSELQKKADVKEPKKFQKKEEPQKKKDLGWKSRMEKLKAEFTNEGNKMAVSHLWQEILYLLMHLKPKYIRAEIDFSAGDPAVTGQVTGVLSLLPILYQYDTHIYPDFLSEEFYIRGSFKLKGHISLYHFIRCFIRVWKDKNIRKLYYKFRK